MLNFKVMSGCIAGFFLVSGIGLTQPIKNIMHKPHRAQISPNGLKLTKEIYKFKGKALGGDEYSAEKMWDLATSNESNDVVLDQEYWAEIAAENGSITGMNNCVSYMMEKNTHDLMRSLFWAKKAKDKGSNIVLDRISEIESRLGAETLKLLQDVHKNSDDTVCVPRGISEKLIALAILGDLRSSEQILLFHLSNRHSDEIVLSWSKIAAQNNSRLGCYVYSKWLLLSKDRQSAVRAIYWESKIDNKPVLTPSPLVP